MDFIGKWSAIHTTEVGSLLAPPSSLFRNSINRKDLQLIISNETAEEVEALSIGCICSDGLLTHETYRFSQFNYQTDQKEDEIILTIVQNFMDPFKSFHILRLGPYKNQVCSEFYRLDDDETLRVVMISKDDDGVVHHTHRFFKCIEKYSNPGLKQFESLLKTTGWDNLQYWPATSLDLCEVKVVKVTGIHTEPDAKEEVLWALDQPIDEIKKHVYSAEPFNDPVNLLFYTLQVTSGKSQWRVSRAHLEITALATFLHNQDNHIHSALPHKVPPLTFKSYVEFHRMVIANENMFRGYFQAAAEMNASHVYSLLAFFEVPQHLEQEQVALVQSFLEEDVEGAQGAGEFVALKVDLDRLPPIPEPFVEETPPVDQSQPSPFRRQGSIYNSNSFAPTKPPLGKQGVARTASYTENPYVPPPTYPPSPQSREFSRNSSREGSINFRLSPKNSITSMDDRTSGASSPSLVSLIKRTYSDSLDGIEHIYQGNEGAVAAEAINSGTRIALKILPVETVSSPPVKATIARGLLFGVLEQGLSVIKHGRQGHPKKKLLKCDPLVTRLFWMSDHGQHDQEDRHIELSQVISIRLGTDIDPATSAEALAQAAEDGSVSITKLAQVAKEKDNETIKAKPAPKKGLCGGLFHAKEDGILYGTACLRRTCKAEDLPLCISLILPDRTFDIQCLNQKDLNLLLINLREVIKPTVTVRPESPKRIQRQMSANLADATGENPLKSRKSVKSVRFLNLSLDNIPRVDSTNATNVSDGDDVGIVSLGSNSASQIMDPKVIFTLPSDGDLDNLLEEGGDGVQRPVQRRVNSQDLNRPSSPMRMTSTEALQIGLILSEQEKAHRSNMYDSLKPDDQPRIQHYVSKGLTTEEAILKIFEQKFGSIDPEENQTEDETPQSNSNVKISAFFPRLLDGKMTNVKLSAAEALQVGILLSQREEEFGTNMYDSLLPEDYQRIQELTEEGQSTYEAVLKIFEERYGQMPSNPCAEDNEGEGDEQYKQDENQEEGSSEVPRRGIQRAGSSFFPNTNSVLPANFTQINSASSPSRDNPRRLDSQEAMELAMLLSDQEARYGTNMYDSLKPEDEDELQRLVDRGYSMEKSVEIIFNAKYNPSANKSLAEAQAEIFMPTNGYPANYPPPPPPGPYGYPYPPQGYPPQGYPPQGYPPQGYPPQGYPPQGYLPEAYPQGYGYSPPGYPPQQGYPPQNYPPQHGYPPQQGPPGYPPQQYPPQYPPEAYPQGYYPHPYPYGGAPYGYYPPNGQAPPHQPSPQASPGNNRPPSGSYSAQPRGVPHAQSESFYGEIVPTELTALVQDTPGGMQRMPSVFQVPRRQSANTMKPVSNSGSNENPPVAAAPLSSSPAPSSSKKVTKKMSIFSRRSSGVESSSGKQKLKYKEADVKAIMQMGFTRDQAVWSLVQNDNNVVNAIMSLTG